MDTLTPQARRSLSQLKAKLAPGQGARKKLTPVWQGVAAWAQERALVSHADTSGQHLYISYALLQQIDRQLRLDGEAPLSANLKQSSLEQAKLGATEVKSMRVAPRDQRVLIALPCTDATDPWGQDNWLFRDIDLNLLRPQDWTHLIAVENLDCFYQLHRFALSLPERALLLYRGDRMYAKGVKQLRALPWVRQLPNYYFGDLDPAGLRIAKSDNYDHIAAPSFEWFTECAHAADCPAEQHKYLSGLTQMAALQPYVDFMTAKQSAVKQQKLQGIPLSWLALDTEHQ